MSGPGDFRVVIPARYDSQRLPGKPLRLLAGRPMIAHVWERALESGAREVLVATDDDRIRAAVEELGGRAVMTSAACASGTDRIAEVAAREGWGDDEIIVNLQGDEPLMPGALIRRAAGALAAAPSAAIATLVTRLRDARDLFDPNVVKVVAGDDGHALYFSRAPIPWARDAFADPGAEKRELPAGVAFLRHLGLYAYRPVALRIVTAAGPQPCERTESLEQLRALELGLAIAVALVEEAPGHGVDTEADLARVERLLAGGGGTP